MESSSDSLPYSYLVLTLLLGIESCARRSRLEIVVVVGLLVEREVKVL